MIDNQREKLSVVIIEDEKDAQSLLENIITEFCPSLEIIGFAEEVESARKLISEKDPDLVFLDIEIKNGTGFQVIEGFEDRSFKTIVTTAYDQYALKAFKHEATDYLLKPYSPSEVKKAVDKIKSSHVDYQLYQKLNNFIYSTSSTKKSTLSITTSEGIALVKYANIIRLEADRSYCKIHIKDKEPINSSKALAVYEKQLPEDIFLKVHQSHLVNKSYITDYKKEDGGILLLENGSKIPIARRRKPSYLKSFLDEFKAEAVIHMVSCTILYTAR